jgi:hypothetical protein
MARKKRPGGGVDATGRSKHDGQHVRLYEWMLNSPAWRSLDCVERSLLIELYRLYRPNRNGELDLSVRRAATLLNVSSGKAGQAFHALVDRGFIRPRQRGDFDWKARHSTSWVLAEFPFAGQLPSKEFMRWRPTESVSLDGQMAPAEKQRSVSPRGQSVSPDGQTVSLGGQMDPAEPRSVSPRGQIPPDSTPICPSGDTYTVTMGGGGVGDSADHRVQEPSLSSAPTKEPWRAPTYIEPPKSVGQEIAVMDDDVKPGVNPPNFELGPDDRCPVGNSSAFIADA